MLENNKRSSLHQRQRKSLMTLTPDGRSGAGCFMDVTTWTQKRGKYNELAKEPYNASRATKTVATVT
jgi:hypothetical protein